MISMRLPPGVRWGGVRYYGVRPAVVSRNRGMIFSDLPIFKKKYLNLLLSVDLTPAARGGSISSSFF